VAGRDAVIDTRALATQIERMEIHALHNCVESARRVAPHLHAEITDIAGGAALFAGVASPLSEATGLGIFAPVTAADVKRMTTFYVNRATPPRVSVSPFAELNLVHELARASYRPVEHQNVLACAIEDAACGRDERVVESYDPHAWGRASASGFMERDASDDEAIVGTLIAAARDVVALEMRSDAGVLATAAMNVQGELAGLFAGSTMLAARRQGLQTVLIRDRLARAHAAGARYARTSAAAGSTSEQNLRRAGFEVLFTRTVWERELSGDCNDRI
jgi:hypothetical protein